MPNMSNRDPQRTQRLTNGRKTPDLASASAPSVALEREGLEAELSALRSEIEKRKTESKVLAARVAGLRDLCGRLQERAQKARETLVELADSDRGLEPSSEEASAIEPLSLGDLEAELIDMGFDIQPATAKRARESGEEPSD